MHYGSIIFSKKFLGILKDIVSKKGGDFLTGNKIISFKNSEYSHSKGGFHPVEIMISNGQIQYITDFTYFGNSDELVKDLDFDFSHGVFQQLGVGQSREYPIIKGKTLFKLWEKNFCHYHQFGAYDNIEVSE